MGEVERKTALVTGANSGLGLALTEQLLAQGWHVYAASLHDHNLVELQTKYEDKLDVCIGDLTEVKQQDALVKCLGGSALDAVIHSAAVYDTPEGAIDLDADGNLDTTSHSEPLSGVAKLRLFRLNTLVPLSLSRQLLPHLTRDGRQGLVVPIVSLTMGASGPPTVYQLRHLAYSTSKRSLRELMGNFAASHPQIKVLPVHPGWMRTKIGGPNGKVAPAVSAAKIVHIISRALERPEEFSSGKAIDLRAYNLV